MRSFSQNRRKGKRLSRESLLGEIESCIRLVTVSKKKNLTYRVPYRSGAFTGIYPPARESEISGAVCVVLENDDEFKAPLKGVFARIVKIRSQAEDNEKPMLTNEVHRNIVTRRIVRDIDDVAFATDVFHLAVIK